MFQLIADPNKGLKEIEIEIRGVPVIDRSAESALEWVGELVKIFRKCRKLSFEIWRSREAEPKKEDLMRICKVLPCRGMDVYVKIARLNFRYPEPVPWIWK